MNRDPSSKRRCRRHLAAGVWGEEPQYSSGADQVQAADAVAQWKWTKHRGFRVATTHQTMQSDVLG